MKLYTVTDDHKHDTQEFPASSGIAAARKYVKVAYGKDVKVHVEYGFWYRLSFPVVRWLDPAPSIRLYVREV